MGLDRICELAILQLFTTHETKKRNRGITNGRDITEKFFWGEKVIFPDFFPGVKCIFPVENFHFGRPKTNFSGFEKWNNLPFSIFQFSIFPFTIFLSFFSISTPFPFFPCLFFPSRSAEISWSEVSGALCTSCYLLKMASHKLLSTEDGFL